MPLLLASALAALVVAPIAAPIEQAAAAGARIITIGETTDARQRLELLRAFDASGPDDVAIVTLDDAAPLDDLFGGAEGVWSSTVLACEAPGAGLTIDAAGGAGVSPALFALPLTAAGMTDASLRVAVPAGAPQEPVSALAGVFKTWGVAPCAAPDGDGSGRQIALDGLTLATDIAAAISPDDPTAGIEPAALLILKSQGAALADPAHLATVLAAEERNAGIALPAAERKLLGEFLGRTVAHDWATLAGGWSIETTSTADGFGVTFLPAPVPTTAEVANPAEAVAAPATGAIDAAKDAASRVGGGMTGIASAVLAGAAEAEASATAEAERIRDLSAAIAPAALPSQPGPAVVVETPPPATATPVPTPTAAEIAATEVAARATVEARATEAALTAAAEARAATATAEAQAALIATAEAPTPTPEPVLSAAPVDIDGTLVGAGSGRVAIAQPGQPQAEFRVARNARVSRESGAGTLADLVAGDRVRLTIDGRNGLVTALQATPAGQPPPVLPLLGLALVPLLLGALVLNRRRASEPFVVVYRPSAAG